MSLLVRRPGHAPLLLVGDLTYDLERMLRGDVPGSGDKAEMHRSSDLIAGLRERLPDLVILAAHDPAPPRTFEPRSSRLRRRILNRIRRLRPSSQDRSSTVS